MDMQTNSNKLDQIVKPLKTIDLSGTTQTQEEAQEEPTNTTPNNNNQNGGGNNNMNNQGYTPSNAAGGNPQNGGPNGNPPGFPFYNKFPQGQGHGGAPMIHHPPFQYPQYHPHPPGMPPFIRGNLFMPF
jgi:hypothetical protein